jgi:non-ribosomal peptide synthetase component E (peptide arylation enzyme)
LRRYARSIGRPGIGTEAELRPVTAETPVNEENPDRLMICGASVCLGTMGRDSGTLQVLAEHDEGWYDTGDLAIPDGRGGYRLVGRASDRIGGAFMIPVPDVEMERVEALPRNQMGQVETARLRAWLASETGLATAAGRTSRVPRAG